MIENYLTDINTFIGENLYLNIAGRIFAFIGIVVTFFPKKSKKRKPKYIVRTLNLGYDSFFRTFGEKVYFNGEEIKNLSFSKIAFWNDGKKTIRKSDIPQKTPLQVRIDDSAKILKANIIYEKNEANNFIIRQNEDGKSIDLNFEYMEQNEGVVLEIFHNGYGSEILNLEGKFISATKLKRVNNKIFRYSLKLRKDSWSGRFEFPNYITFAMASTSIMYGLVTLSLTTIVLLFPEKLGGELYKMKILNMPFLGIELYLFALLCLFQGKRLLKPKLPKGFELFYKIDPGNPEKGMKVVYSNKKPLLSILKAKFRV